MRPHGFPLFVSPACNSRSTLPNATLNSLGFIFLRGCSVCNDG